MNWKLMFFLIFNLVTTATHAVKSPKQGTLMLKGVVPLKVGVILERDRTGALVPTLRSNAPDAAERSIKLKTTRAPASLSEDTQRVVIESN